MTLSSSLSGQALRVALFALGLAALAACAGDGKKTTQACDTDYECAGGVCFDSQCYTSCTNQDQCQPDEFCVHKTSGAGEADVCVTASEFEGCADDLACEALVAEPCEAARCDATQGLCFVTDLADGEACTSRDGSGQCLEGACRVEVTCTPVGDGPDLCDGVDDDCDGGTDEDHVVTETTCGIGACEVPGHVVCAEGQEQTQCAPGLPPDENDASCDGVDSDCDGATDEDCVICTPSGDPADDCDGVDDDCDGETDEEFVADEIPCGLGVCQVPASRVCLEGQVVDQCAPGLPPVETDAECNGLDDDCDGQTDEEVVVTPTTCGTGPCAAEGQLLCEAGVPVDTCAPGQPLAVDDATCDNVDDDCDGVPDDELPVELPDGSVVFGSGLPCGTGACAGGVTECYDWDGEVWLICSTLPPFSETVGDVCNGLDDDCDGLTDAADLDLAADSDRRCELGDGECEGALKPLDHCQGGIWLPCTTADYLAWAPAYEPGAEATCDGLDNDCDADVDEDFSLTLPDGALVAGPGKACGTGACAGGVTQCESEGLVCTTAEKADSEACNGLDDDCDGLSDEAVDLPCGPGLLCVDAPQFDLSTACVECFDANDQPWDGCDYTTLAETQVNESTAANEHRPAVVALTDGGFAVTWTAAYPEQPNNAILGKRYTPEGAVAAGEFQVNQETSGAQCRQSQLAPTPDGGFVVLWGRHYAQLVVRAFDGVAKPLADEAPVADDSQNLTDWAMAGSAKAERFVVAESWVDYELQYQPSVLGLGFDDGLQPLWGPAPVNGEYDGFYVSDGRVAVFDDGSSVFAWVYNGADATTLRVRLVAADGTPAAEFAELVPPTGLQNAGFAGPALAAFPDGSFVVAYRVMEYSEVSRMIEAQRFTPDGKADGEPVRVDTLPFDEYQDPAVAAFPDGGFVVAFPARNYDSQSDTDLYVRWFLPDNKPRDVEQVAHTYPPGDQIMPGVAAFPDGTSAVAWASCDVYGAASVAQDGAECGVYLQRFSAEGGRLQH
jgi:hypothetical protein